VTKTTKLPEIRKEAFVKAREALGLSAKDVSGMSCLSVRQIEQIENGESSSFYGAQVKLTAAKKVAGLLKLKEEDAFDFGDVLQNKKGDSEKVAQETKDTDDQNDALEEKKLKSDKPTRFEQPAEIKAQKSIPFHSSTANSSAAKNPKKKLVILFGIAAALVFSIINLRPLFFPEVVKEEVVAVEEAAPANASDQAGNDAKPNAAASASEPVAAVATPAVTQTSECPPADIAPVSYRPDAPKKAGDMVYLQSKTAQIVCVVDASGKIQNKALEPGVGISIYGKPPLKVLTSGQAPVDMYYQGAKVRLSNTTAKNIILEPAEIVQPLAPTDSQLR
jgi:cytoskeleton protein RodZ